MRIRKRLFWFWADTVWRLQRRGWFEPPPSSEVGGAFNSMAPHIRPSQRDAFLRRVCHGAGTAPVGYDASGPYLDYAPDVPDLGRAPTP